MKHYLGIEIGGSKFQAVIGNPDARILERYRKTVDKKLGGAGIREEILKSLASFKKYKPVSIGLGFGGPIDYEKGVTRTSHQIEGWNNFPIGPWLRQISGLPVHMDNDANSAALAEAVKGSGKNSRRVFYVTLGSGMGGGMVIDGTIYHGEKPGEAEIGLMPFDRKSNTMESQCCGWSVDRKIREYAKRKPKSALAELTGKMNGGESKYLIQAIEKGDKGAERILDDTTDNIAYALSYVVLLFHPKVFVIGGGLSLIGEPLVIRIQACLPKYVVPAFHPVPKVKIARLGEDVVSIGALLLAIQADKKALQQNHTKNLKHE